MSKPDNPILFNDYRTGPSDEVPVLFTDITLRDLFAAAALNGMIANSRLIIKPEGFASNAYAYADLMLAERSSDADG